jgi:hypothetical protein
MSNKIHHLGDLVRVHTNPDYPKSRASPFVDAITGELKDPAAVKLTIKDPTGTVTTYTYLSGAMIVKDGVGKYHADVDANLAGTWYYRWWSTGDGQAGDERSFEVRAAQAVES